MTGLRASVEAALNAIVDPCSRATGRPLGLVDMGLIEGLQIGADGAVQLGIVPTSPLCMMTGVFLAEARQALAAIDGVTRIEVRLDAEHIWTPERMTVTP